MKSYIRLTCHSLILEAVEDGLVYLGGYTYGGISSLLLILSFPLEPC
jgi:hypothetical protein